MKMRRIPLLFLVVVFLSSLLPLGGAVYATTTTFPGGELLGKPTDTSITINIIPEADIEYYYEYGTAQGGPYTGQTTPVIATGDEPHEVEITGLSPNTQYYYRMVYDADLNVGDGYETRPEHSFHTQRAEGEEFVFTIIADSHAQYNTQYQQALLNVAADQPDFHFDLGDTFMTDNDGSQSAVNTSYLAQRKDDTLGDFMDLVGHSAPIFLASGNHENEEGWNLDDSFSPALASIQARKLYYPTPISDGFYTGNDDILADINAGTYGDQYREDYYAWEWGDALFVVFDPYQYTMQNPYGNTAGEGSVGDNDPATGDRWNWTLGQEQFNWFKNVLATSDAKYKFIFAHHKVGRCVSNPQVVPSAL